MREYVVTFLALFGFYRLMDHTLSLFWRKWKQRGRELPSNRLERPVDHLIEHLSHLPYGTTYKIENEDLYGGEQPSSSLGTSYGMKITIVEGFNPPRTIKYGDHLGP